MRTLEIARSRSPACVVSTFVGEVETRGHDVDGDDPGCRCQRGGHDGGQPHRTRAEHGHGVSGAGAQLVEDGTGTDLDSAADRGEQRQFVLVGGLDRHDAAFVGHRVPGEGGLSEEASAERALANERGASVPGRAADE
ncbi:hypothetical protein [Streptomyces viridochromogenes]|uniref:hypothetical protein n=1 Tax=Streptomyces viridochromogenes TaxID=1938 RepID=UPI00069E1348|nr:hypothetical protein ADK36_11980 [Streptomyces viridochromogenes]KOG29719.1 hypothetical protein ADK35_00060 [Streptomyces viridochromogenes]